MPKPKTFIRSQENETASIYELSKKTTETDLLLYEDAEGYNAFLEVGEDFGCIHYQKEEEDD